MRIERNFQNERLAQAIATLPEEELALAIEGLLDPDDGDMDAHIARSVEEGRRAHRPEEAMSAQDFLAARKRGDFYRHFPSR